MCSYTKDELQEALRPIASLISKSEKAQEKLRPGTWQHTMLQSNLKALHIALALMTRETGDGPVEPTTGGPGDARVPSTTGELGGARAFTQEDLQDALRALAAMIGKAEKAQAKFAPGTSQHTLQRNRIRALRIAETLTRSYLDGSE